MKTSELTGAQLDYWVARAEGVKAGFENAQCAAYETPKGRQIKVWTTYSPSTDWAQGGPLIDKYGLTVEPYPPAWWANEPDETAVMGEDPLQAICRAVVRAAFGDEVEEVLS